MIHALEAASAGLGNREPHPHAADKGNGREAPEGSLGGDAAVRGGEEHVGHGAGVAVLVGKVQSHGPRGGEGSDAEREQLSSEEVLHGVPAESPTEAGDVDHGDGAAAGTLVGSGKDKVIDDTELRDASEEGGDVDHGDSLESDTSEESALSADDINEEESADDGGNKLDDTKDGSDEKRLLATSDTENLEQIRSVEGDGTSTGPLRQELNHGGEVEAVEVAGNKEHLLDLSKPANTLASLKLVVKSRLDRADLRDDILAIRRLSAKTTQNVGGLVGLTLLNQETRRLVLEEAEDEDDAGHHDVQGGGNQPAVVGVLVEVEGAAIVGEVGEDDTEVDSAGEHATAETTDGGRGDFGNVDGSMAS